MDKFLTKTKRKAAEDTSAITADAESGKDELSSPKKSKSEVVEEQREISEWLKIPIETLKTDQDYEDYFTKLANFLLNNVVLRINKQPHRLLEIEFYFTNEDETDGVLVHHDPFTHCDKLQQQSGIWYFHKTGNAYRGGSYKGIDIAIGRGDRSAGGILIRSLQSLSDGKVVCGPSKSVDHILEVCKVDGIKTLVGENMKDDISALPHDGAILFLEPSNSFDKTTMYRSGRVGLHMTKKTDPQRQKEYVFKHYRYFVEPKKITKGNHYASIALLYKGFTVTQIAAILPTRASVVEKYKESFEEGKKMSEDKFLTVKMTDHQVCQAYGSLHKLLTW